MNQNIITYLAENKEKYPKDVLIAELHKAGYSEGDIAEGIAHVFGLPAIAGAKEGLSAAAGAEAGGAVPAVAPAKTSFWNFKDKKIYTKESEKWADFLFGLLGLNIILGGIVTLIGIFPNSPEEPVLSILMLFTEAILGVYFFHRRRFIFYGVIFFPALFLPFIITFFISTVFSGHLF